MALTRSAPPKPVPSAQVYTVNPPAGQVVPEAAQPIKAWSQLWHALGSNLPWYINHSRASRRALNRRLARGG